MAHYRAAIAFKSDTDFPRDYISINPHYSGDNPQALGDSLKAAILAAAGITPGTPFTIKIYDDEKAPPSYPLYTTENPGTAHVNTAPREVALCLSFYSGFNRPSLRGRLYIPQILYGGVVGLKPTTGQQNAVLALKDVFKAPAAQGHQWVVWSKTQKLASIVTNVWVDNEWDTVRSRGLRSDARVSSAA